MFHYCACDIKFYSLIWLEVNAAKTTNYGRALLIFMSRCLSLDKIYFHNSIWLLDAPKDFLIGRFSIMKVWDSLLARLCRSGKDLKKKL